MGKFSRIMLILSIIFFSACSQKDAARQPKNEEKQSSHMSKKKKEISWLLIIQVHFWRGYTKMKLFVLIMKSLRLISTISLFRQRITPEVHMFIIRNNLRQFM